MNIEVKKSSIRGWLILLCAVIMTFCFQGAISNQQSLFLEPASTGLGMSRSLYSSLDALTQTANLICTLSFSILVVKLGIVRMLRIGSWATVVYCIGMYLAGKFIGASVILVAISQISLGLFCSLTSVVAISAILNSWFARRRGLVIGFSQAASGIGGVVFTPVVQNLIVNSGWMNAMLFRGILCAVASIAICAMLREKPGPNEERVWERLADDSELEEKKATDTGLTLREAAREYKFYLAIVFYFLAICVICATLGTLAAYASDIGYMNNISSIMMTVYAVCFVSQLVSGSLMERFGLRRVIIPTLVILGIMCVLLSANAPSLAVFYIAAACLGVSWLIWTIAPPMMTIQLFGEKDFPRIQSFLYAGTMAGAILGYPAFNFIFDATGSYAGAFKACIAIVAVMIVIIFVLTGKNKVKE